MAVSHQETDNAEKWRREDGIEARLLGRYRDRVLDRLRLAAPSRMIDVGCGEGTLTAWIADRMPSTSVDALDVRGAALDELRAARPDIGVHEGDLYAMPFEAQSYDLAVALEVLEHLDDPERALEELARVAGTVLVTVPLEPVFRLGNVSRGRYLDRFGNTPGHQHTWDPVRFRRLARKALGPGSWFELGPWQGYVTAPRPTDGGQQALETHFDRWSENAEADFRTPNLERLVAESVPRGRVLDIGCGVGGLSSRLLRRGDEVVSQDMSESILDACRRSLAAQGLSDHGVRRGRIEDISPAERYDAITALDVIEHIDDDRAAVAAMTRVLAPEGRLVVTVPALSALYGPKDVAIGHYRRYDRAHLRDLLEGLGLEVEDLRFWNLLGVGPVWVTARLLRRRLDEGFRYGTPSAPKRALNRALGAWFRLVEHRLRPPLGVSLIAVARRRER